MNIFKKVSVVPLLLLGGMLTASGTEVLAQTVPNFNMNTQLTDLRSNGSNNNPGFNPCRGGVRSGDGRCVSSLADEIAPGGPGADDDIGMALLDIDNLKDTFPSLGPGAVTDNMFGVVSGPDLQGDGPGGFNGDILTSACGETINGNTLEGLNCGDIRFDPISQGQQFVGPEFTGNNTLVTPAGGLNMNTQFIADFCSSPGPVVPDCPDGGGTQKIAAHTGFSITNNFNFKFLTGTTSEVTASQSMRQVTAVKTNLIGTQAAPGAGDQLVVISANWATTPANPSSNNPATNPSNLTVNWTQLISDPDQSGTGSGSFTQDIGGSFVYQGTAAAISAQYPSGKTQTERSIGVAAPQGETQDFAAVP